MEQSGTKVGFMVYAPEEWMPKVKEYAETLIGFKEAEVLGPYGFMAWFDNEPHAMTANMILGVYATSANKIIDRQVI